MIDLRLTYWIIQWSHLEWDIGIFMIIIWTEKNSWNTIHFVHVLGYEIKSTWLISSIMKIFTIQVMVIRKIICICSPKLGQWIVKLELSDIISFYLLRNPPPQNETWTNKVCRPGNSTYTVVNANCYQGVCQCNPGYIASLEKDFCHYCPAPKAWNHFSQTCEDENKDVNYCNPFSFTCTRNDLTVRKICTLDKNKMNYDFRLKLLG